MKKKLVAFAVTAAMVVASAVPALAWEVVDNTPAFDTTQNQIVLTNAQKDGIVDDTVGGTIPEKADDAITFQTIVDFNRITAASYFDLNFTGDEDAKGSVRLTASVAGSATNGKDAAVKLGTKGAYTPVDGITVLNWSVSKEEGVKVTVDQLCTNSDNGEGAIVLKGDIPEGVDTLKDITVTTAKQVVIYQYEAPTKVAEVMVAEYDFEKKDLVRDADGNIVPATQAVQGKSYAVYGIKLNDGTVISVTDDIKAANDDIEEYAVFNWEVKNAKGESQIGEVSVTSFYGLSNGMITIPENNEKVAGCTITVTADSTEGNGATSGIFGKATWGADTDPLAAYERIAGEDRYATAMAIADKLAEAGKVESVIIANGENYADALSATALAKAVGAPILLVNDAHEDAVVEWVETNVKDYRTPIYVIGGEAVISEDFCDNKLLRYDVERISGDDRYATNLAILEKLADPDINGLTKNILVCSGSNYPDALSASATGKAVLLVGDTLTAGQIEYLTELKTDGGYEFVIVGGNKVVSDEMLEAVKAFDTNTAVNRLYGADRYETNEKVINSYFSKPGQVKNVVLASGDGFADALAGAAFAAQQDTTPVIIVNDAHYERAFNFVRRAANADIIVVGGEVSVSSELVQKIA